MLTRLSGRRRGPRAAATREEAGIDHPILAGLIAGGRIEGAAAARARARAVETGLPLPVVLRELELLGEEEWVEAAVEHLGVERATTEEVPAEPLLDGVFARSFLRHNRLLPLAADARELRLAMADPADAALVHAAAVASGRAIVPVVMPLAAVEAAHARYWDQGAEAIARIVADLGEEEGGGETTDPVGEAEEAPVVRLVDQLLADGVRLRASDLHVEPTADRLRVRFRVHGSLREAAAPPARLGPAVVSRIKILAGLDVAERRLPQDGRTRLQICGRQVDLRVATMPTIHGESVVVRILDHSQRRVGLGELGLPPDIEARFSRQLGAPHGMLLVTGPTGSGKTTTLYAALQQLDATAAKIVSIEDPIEYQLPGITQIQVRPEIGLDFARVLRAVLRHDPDTVMVGETRDPETAEVAIHAALTGHLLLTTLHTNTAAGAVARLLDMGVEPYLLASVVRGVLGQRLVGLLCPDCRRPEAADAGERELLRRAGLAAEEGVTLFRPVGCRSCEGVGYVGRVGIFEFLEVDEEIREAIRARASTQELLALARGRGMTTMFEDGAAKCLAGRTTLQDVCRVTENW